MIYASNSGRCRIDLHLPLFDVGPSNPGSAQQRPAAGITGSAVHNSATAPRPMPSHWRPAQEAVNGQVRVGLTTCNDGRCQPQEQRGAGPQPTIKAKSHQPEMKRNVLFSGTEPRCAGKRAAWARNYSPPGRARSERLCELSEGCYCCTFLLYSRFEHSNFASDLWS